MSKKSGSLIIDAFIWLIKLPFVIIFGIVKFIYNIIKENKKENVQTQNNGMISKSEELAIDKFDKLLDKYEDDLDSIDFDSNKTIKQNENIYSRKLEKLNKLKEFCFANGEYGKEYFEDMHQDNFEYFKKEFEEIKIECAEQNIKNKIEKLKFNEEKSLEQNKKTYDKKITLCDELLKHYSDNNMNNSYPYKQQIEQEYNWFLEQKQLYDKHISDITLIEETLLKYPDGILQKDFAKDENLTHLKNEYIYKLIEELVNISKVIKVKHGKFYFVKPITTEKMKVIV